MVVSSKIPITKLENQDIGIGALIGWFLWALSVTTWWD